MRLLKLLSATLLALLPGLTVAQAQTVTYQREITFPGTVDAVLPTAYAPMNPASVAAPGVHRLYLAGPSNGFFSDFSSSGASTGPSAFPSAIKLDSTSRAAISGFGTTASTAYFYTSTGQLITFAHFTAHIVLPSPFVEAIIEASSLAASSSGQVTLIGTDTNFNHGGFVINTTTGDATKVFSTQGDSFLSNTTLYQSYGADGLLYLLDHGNSRIAVLDPANSFSLTRSINFTGTVANMQFALSHDGSLFLGDGAGGGSMYSAAGSLVSTFLLPAGSYANPFTNGITPYVDYTPDGHVFIFDATGAHQYAVFAIPEPSTYAALTGLALFGLTLCQRLKNRRIGLTRAR
ncbi:MAG: hypothetical protein V4773_12070 [Verrucomicrobiota bacterium]